MNREYCCIQHRISLKTSMCFQAILMVPMRGTASEVVGMLSATRFRKTVSDNRIVTPVITNQYHNVNSLDKYISDGMLVVDI